MPSPLPAFSTHYENVKVKLERYLSRLRIAMCQFEMRSRTDSDAASMYCPLHAHKQKLLNRLLAPTRTDSWRDGQRPAQEKESTAKQIVPIMIRISQLMPKELKFEAAPIFRAMRPRLAGLSRPAEHEMPFLLDLWQIKHPQIGDSLACDATFFPEFSDRSFFGTFARLIVPLTSCLPASG